MRCDKTSHSFTGIKSLKALEFPPPPSPPLLYRSEFEPMKESVMTPDKAGYWFDVTAGRLHSQRFRHCLHALCILYYMHDETEATRRPAAPAYSCLPLWSSCSCSGVKTATLSVRLCVSSASLRCLLGSSHCSDVFLPVCMSLWNVERLLHI